MCRAVPGQRVLQAEGRASAKALERPALCIFEEKDHYGHSMVGKGEIDRRQSQYDRQGSGNEGALGAHCQGLGFDAKGMESL